MERLKAAIPRLAAVVGCGGLLLSCDATPTRNSSITEEIRMYWAQGQEALEPYVGQRAYLVHPDQFTFEQHPGPFKCGDIEDVYGCFHPWGQRIEWWDIRVIRHEAQHAILWRLSDSRYKCVEHEPDCIDQ